MFYNVYLLKPIHFSHLCPKKRTRDRSLIGPGFAFLREVIWGYFVTCGLKLFRY